MENSKIAELRERLAIRKEFVNLRGKKYLKLFDKFEKLWAGYFEKQVEEYDAYVENNPQMFIARKSEDSDFLDENEAQLTEVYALGMEMQNNEITKSLSIGFSFNVRMEGAENYAKNRAGELIKGVDETTKKEVSKIMEDAMTEGLTMWEVRDRIRDTFAGYSKYRAGLIAVMETGNAYESGKREQFDRYADKFGTKGWKRSRVADATARPTHLQNQEDGWIPADKLFSGTQTDHAPHGFNCRCSVSYSIFDPNNPNFLGKY